MPLFDMISFDDVAGSFVILALLRAAVLPLALRLRIAVGG